MEKIKVAFVVEKEASMRQIPTSEWKWFGNAGHLIVSRWCQFHLCTEIGNVVVSTVGEYWPERPSREIHAKIHDPVWLAHNRHLNGDFFDAACMKRFGFEEIGCGRTFETMVFRVSGHCEVEGCNRGMPTIIPDGLEARSYSDAGSATKGHMELCEIWSKKHRKRK